MAEELLYTSVPRGLISGSRGFCVVEATAGISPPLVTALEMLSGYRHIAPPGDPANPPVHRHVMLTVGGRRLAVLSRVSDAGLDYSDRSNKLAHHVVLPPGEQTGAGPAWALLQPGVMKTGFDGRPKQVPPRSLPAGAQRPRVCAAWEAATGDAGWAGVLAETVLDGSGRLVYLTVPPSLDLLPLFAEAIALLPPERRWRATFTTYHTTLPQAATCQWRGVLAGSPEAAEAARLGQALRLDLTRPLGRANGGALVELARTGRPNQPTPAPRQPSTAHPETETPDDAASLMPPTSRPQSAPPLPKTAPRPSVRPALAPPAPPERRHSWPAWKVLTALTALVVLIAAAGAAIHYIQSRETVTGTESQVVTTSIPSKSDVDGIRDTADNTNNLEPAPPKPDRLPTGNESPPMAKDGADISTDHNEASTISDTDKAGATLENSDLRSEEDSKPLRESEIAKTSDSPTERNNSGDHPADEHTTFDPLPLKDAGSVDGSSRPWNQIPGKGSAAAFWIAQDRRENPVINLKAAETEQALYVRELIAGDRTQTIGHLTVEQSEDGIQLVLHEEKRMKFALLCDVLSWQVIQMDDRFYILHQPKIELKTGSKGPSDSADYYLQWATHYRQSEWSKFYPAIDIDWVEIEFDGKRHRFKPIPGVKTDLAGKIELRSETLTGKLVNMLDDIAPSKGSINVSILCDLGSTESPSKKVALDWNPIDLKDTAFARVNGLLKGCGILKDCDDIPTIEAAVSEKVTQNEPKIQQKNKKIEDLRMKISEAEKEEKEGLEKMQMELENLEKQLSELSEPSRIANKILPKLESVIEKHRKLEKPLVVGARIHFYVIGSGQQRKPVFVELERGSKTDPPKKDASE